MDLFRADVALQYHHLGAAMPAPRDNTFGGVDGALVAGHPSSLNPMTPSDPSNPQALFAQFQARYPAGSLTAELVHIQGETYVVRAVVQVGGVVLASGLSAASSIEAAEDRARLRALEVLGFRPPTPAPVGERPTPSAYELQVRLMTNHSSEPDYASLEEPEAILTRAVSYEDPPALTSQPVASRPLSSAVDPSSDFELEFEEPLPAPEPTRNPARGRKSSASAEPAAPNRRNTRTPAPPPEPPQNQPLDLSDAIAQTTVEIKRLGWTEAQGRNYLQRTYGKRSRQYLTAEELLDFLHYLQEQPSPNESPF